MGFSEKTRIPVEATYWSVILNNPLLKQPTTILLVKELKNNVALQNSILAMKKISSTSAKSFQSFPLLHFISVELYFNLLSSLHIFTLKL